MIVNVKASIRQIVDGFRYEGHLTIVETTFHYDLRLLCEIPRLDNMRTSGNAEEFRRLIKIRVMCKEVEIILEDEEYDVFMAITMFLAVLFYNDPETRAKQKGIRGAIIRGEGPWAVLGLRLEIGATYSSLVDLPYEACQILSKPKFGCNLVSLN